MKKDSSYQHYSDEDLIAQYRATGDQNFAGELFERYLPLVYGVCLKYLKDAEQSRDVSMDLYEKMLKDLKKYEIAHFRNWLYRVVKSQCLIFLRKQTVLNKYQQNAKAELEFMESEAAMHPDDDSLINATEPHLQWALEQLDEDQRTCVELFYLQDKSYSDIMQATGFNFNQVKSFIQNGKRNLRILLTKKYGQHI